MKPLEDSLAKEGTLRGWVLRVHSLFPLPVGSLCFDFATEDAQLPAPFSLTTTDSPSGTISQNKLCVSCFGHGVLSEQPMITNTEHIQTLLQTCLR